MSKILQETGSAILLETGDALLLDPPAFAMAASANIAGGGANTTAQLSAPASGSFGGGRIQDDSAVAASVDVSTDQYGEWEWCLAASSEAVAVSDVYQFRVTLSGTPLDTYTVDPRWTIGSGVTALPEGWRSAMGEPWIPRPQTKAF